jgi:isocitrate dehydrogenase (NAD+)
MGYPVTLIRGDGIGPEVTEAMRIAVDATGVAIDWNIVNAGLETMVESDTSLSAHVLGAIRETKVAIKGPFATPVGQRTQSVMAQMRKQLNLYAYLQPAKSMAGMNSNFNGLDLVLIYENTEDLSTGIEFDRTTNEAADARDYLARLSGISIHEDAALDVRSVSVLGCRRMIEFAFEYAQANHRHKVTAIHRANTKPFTDGLFLEIAHEMAKDYRNIEFEDDFADQICTQLIQTPQRCDVLVMPPLYGQILCDLCTGLNGGRGVTPSANIGTEYAVFEAVHGPMPQLAGQNQANPTALILSGVMLLQHLGEQEAAQRLQAAVAAVIGQRQVVTPDLAPEGTEPVGTRKMADAIASAL